MQIKNFVAAALGGILVFTWFPVSAWTVNQTFDDQQLGDICGNWWAANGSRVTDVESRSGYGCRLRVDGGTGGYGEWGGGVPHPSALVRGDEYWLRIRTLMPLGFDYDSTGAGSKLKFLRLRTKPTSGGSPAIDWYMNPKSSNIPFQVIYEGEKGCSSHCWSKFGTSADKIELGKWETYEYYVKLDTVSVDNGGQARIRAWKNGKLLADITDRKTLKDTDTRAVSTLIFTYWNGGAPKTQEMYVDDLVITSTPPVARDEQGNRYIGMGEMGFPPLPPLMTVQ